eukprot:scaffold20335_cov63-Phaeocystis_antarctica.AAC.3
MPGHQWESATGPSATEATAIDRRVAAQVATSNRRDAIDSFGLTGYTFTVAGAARQAGGVNKAVKSEEHKDSNCNIKRRHRVTTTK